MVKIRNVDQKWIDVNLCTEEYIKKMQDRHGEGKMVYKNSSEHRGFCFIFSVSQYDGVEDWGVKGMKREEDALCSLFQVFGYKIKLFRNPKAEDIINGLRDISQMKKEEMPDSFIMILKGHGTRKGFWCSDEQVVTKEDIIKQLNNKECKLLAGKPKIILWSACRDGHQDKGTFIPGKTQKGLLTRVQNLYGRFFPGDGPLGTTLPTTSDILISYGSQKGYCGAYARKRGSTYLRNLVEVFAEHGHHLTVTQLLQEVANQVIKETVERPVVEAPMYESLSMRKSMYFFPRLQMNLPGVEIVECKEDEEEEDEESDEEEGPVEDDGEKEVEETYAGEGPSGTQM